MEDFLVRLAQLGFHGVAIAFVYLGYKLKKPLLKAESITPTDATEADNQIRILKIKIKGANKFFGFALCFLIVGAGLDILNVFILKGQEKHLHNINLVIQPKKMPNGLQMPQITSSVAKAPFVEIDQNGRGATQLIHDETILFGVTPLTETIMDQSFQIRELMSEKIGSDGGADEL